MNYSKNLLTRLKAKHCLASDYAAAKILGVSSTILYNANSGKTGLSDDTLIRIAHLIDESAIKIVCEYHLATDESRNMRQFYADILEQHYYATDTVIPDFQRQKSAWFFWGICFQIIYIMRIVAICEL